MAKLDLIRNAMAKRSIDAYMVMSDDFHNSEYVGDYFKVREYLSGFTGSAGTLVITMDKAGLWTDGRYFIQAEKELEGSGIDLFKSGMLGVKTIEEFLKDNLKDRDVLFVDGRTLTYDEGVKINKYLSERGVSMISEGDFVGKLLWEDRPEMPHEKAFSLDVKYAGESREDKLAKIRDRMKEEESEVFVLSSLDDICWLLNIRGNDVEFNPVVLSYMIITMKDVFLYVSSDAIDDELREELHGIKIKDYMDIYDDIKNLGLVTFCDKNIMFDGKKLNYTLGKSIMEYTGAKMVDNPVTYMKAIKNNIEIENIRHAHILDGVALSKFIYYMKKYAKVVAKTEYELGKVIADYRSKNEGYMGESFAPIVAFRENAAMCHYSAKEEFSSKVDLDGLLLFDTGGQYLTGTTDVTRTIAIGNVTDEMKKMYTAVLKGNLRLGSVKFPKGVRGINLDVLARSALWEMGLDYNHGTGHGVGYFLNVHEGPNSIRFRGNDTVVFEEGMLTSNEPGYYAEGKFGIRLENLIMCRNCQNTEYGQFMEFETFTMVPFDLDCVEVSMLNEDEKKLLNDYHSKVYETISPYMDELEKVWLKEATRSI